MLANNEVGTFADFLNRVSVGGERGALLRFGGLPENFIVVNPQFAGADFVGNFSNSTYHSLQINATNLLNNVQWVGIGTDPTQLSTYGRVISVRPMRAATASLRFRF